MHWTSVAADILRNNHLVCFSDDDEEEKAPQPLSSSALIKLAEGDEDVVEDLELSDDD